MSKTIATRTVNNIARAARYYARMVSENPSDTEFAGALALALDAVEVATMERFDADLAGLPEPKFQPVKVKTLGDLIVGYKASQAAHKASEARTVDASEVAEIVADEVGCVGCRKASAYALARGLVARPCRKCA